MQQVIEELKNIRVWVRWMLIAHRSAQLVAWTLSALIALIIFDFVVRLPGVFRMLMLLGGLGAVGWGLGWYLLKIIRFRPTLTQIALRAEHSFPTLQGRLASSLEFALAGTDQVNQLAQRSVTETQARMGGESVRRALAPKRTLRDVGVMCAAIALAVLLSWMNPATAATGLSRIFLPFGNAQWPARTGVESMMNQVLDGAEVYPRGDALPLRAHVIRGPEQQRVDAYYRLRIDGRFTNWQQIVLTYQGEKIHERLIDTSAEEVEFYFATSDSKTRRERVKLEPPPSIFSADLHITPPPYASGRMPPYETLLGPGIDERAVTDTASLVGSSVSFNLTLNKPLPVPEEPAQLETWIRETFGWDDGPLPTFFHDSQRPEDWSLKWTLAGTRTLNLKLIDEYSLANNESISYRIEAVDDRLPVVTITEPQSDEVVLATAIVPLIGEATDDVAISTVGLEAAVLSGGEDPERVSDVSWSEFIDVDSLAANIETDLSLAELSLEEGDVVLVTCVAQDMYDLDGETHEPVRSTVRKLRVISELDFASQLRRQLGAVRHNAIRIENQQGELQDDVIDQGAQPGFSRAQEQIGDRLATQLEEVRNIRKLIERNQLEDSQLEELLRQSEDLLEFAGRASSKATQELQEREKQALDEARENRPSAPSEPAPGQPDEEKASPDGENSGQPTGGANQPPKAGSENQDGGQDNPQASEQEDPDPFGDLDIKEPAEEDREIVEQQQEVRDELEDLIELLDRDEDTWVITRQIKNLLEEQIQLAQETNELGRKTVGQPLEEMSPDDRSELDRIRDKQTELRDRERQIVDSARKRAEALEEYDPQSARGMRAAADQAEDRELDRDMEQAAERVEQNRLQQATRAQQRAIETLKKMLQEMEENEKAKAEELLRQLASLIESITRLITIQENELTALARSRDAGDFAGRDRSMIRLNQNTQAVAAEARAAGQDSRRIARALDRAADAQGASVTALRAHPILPDEVEVAENRSLELLNQAKTLAEELQEKTQQEETRRQREELIEAYREFAEREIVLRDATLKLADLEEFDRRQLMELRRHGSTQEDIRKGIDDLQHATQELMEAQAFTMVHRLINNWAIQISETLLEGKVDVLVTDRQLRIADSIGRLIAALEETMSPPDEFAKDEKKQEPAQGGEGKPPLIPPIAELKLLQGIQEQIYDETRHLDERGDLDAAQRRSRMRDLGSQQRELGEIGKAILEKMNRQQRPTPGPTPRAWTGSRGVSNPMNNLKDTSKITFAAIGLCVSLTFGAKASALQDAGDPPPASPPPTETEKEKVPKSPPSLDDLLGIEGEDEQDGTQDAARREIEEELQRELNEEEIRDAFRLALEKMDLSAELLDVKFDPGLGTQRIQEDIIAKLQQLIDQAKKQNSPQGSSSSPQSDQKPKDQNQKPGKQEGKQDSGSQRNNNPQENQAGNPPPPQDASLNTMIEESRSEWGNLPERIRSMLLQGRKGKYSSLYEKMTSEYYKRLAEDKPH